jgi:hypothetical protein
MLSRHSFFFVLLDIIVFVNIYFKIRAKYEPEKISLLVIFFKNIFNLNVLAVDF